VLAAAVTCRDELMLMLTLIDAEMLGEKNIVLWLKSSSE